MTLAEMAVAVAEELKAASAGQPSEVIANTGGGSRHRGLPEDLRQRFIDVRGALFEIGIFDPVLVRFDSATAPQASTAEIADELGLVAAGL
jgi:hypothetical protein